MKKKIIVGALAAAAVAAPIAMAGSADAAAPAAKATGTVTWNYQGTTGSVVFNGATGLRMGTNDSWRRGAAWLIKNRLLASPEQP